MEHTLQQYDQVIKNCREIFVAKMKDYGSSWRILRPSSLTDQIYIKANRIRSIEEKGMHKVQEGIKPEFLGIVNYSIIALIQLDLKGYQETNLEVDEALVHFNHHANLAKSLMQDKNHDYGEAWRNMRISSLTDIILSKLLRIKQIEDHEGITFVSEGVASNYQDIINYAVFALILMMDESGKTE